MAEIDLSRPATNAERPSSAWRSLCDWAILLGGAGSLAFALLASTTGLVSAGAPVAAEVADSQ